MAAKNNVPEVVYHGTAWRFLDAIMDEGLVAPEKRDGPYVSDTHLRARHYGTGVCAHEYLTTDGGKLSAANRFAVVLRIASADLDLVPDPCSAEPAWIARNGVPPSAILGHTKISCAKVLRNRTEVRRLSELVALHRKLEEMRRDPAVSVADVLKETQDFQSLLAPTR